MPGENDNKAPVTQGGGVQSGASNMANPIVGLGNAAGVAPGGETLAINYRNIKLPTFFSSDPKLWFVQADLVFECNNIRSERQRAGHIISALDYEIIQTISDLLSANPPVENLYTQIKERVTTNFSVSPEKELRSILRGEILSDGKPSLILSKIRHLSRGRCSEEIIKAVFLDHLPENCRAILSMSEVDDVTRLAHVADKVMANMSSTSGSSVSAVSTESEVLKKIDALSKRIDEMSIKPHPSRDSRSRSFFKNRSRSKSRQGQSRDRSKNDRHNGKCYYHNKFGEKAEFCKPPCSYKIKINSKLKSDKDAEN